METPTAEVVGALRDSLKQVQRLRRENERLLTAGSEPIAIVGMSCRFPGGVSSPQDLWRLIVAGEDAIGELPRDRGWDVDDLYDADPDAAGKTYTRHGGFMPEAGWFDAGFFGISPREAQAMDPQQRLLLETAWEALERAGLDPMTLRGGAVGVFAGTNGQDYGAVMSTAPGAVEGYAGTGSAASVLSGRVSYALGLEGPAVTVDTACSSSLVAMHLAGQSLRKGDCTLALAGGVTVMATPAAFVDFSRQRGLAVDGRCKAFAASADGTAWGEGVGMLVLERLSDARRLGHPVLAVIRSSAVNQDGASSGLTAPNGPSQQRVIRAALASAGLTAADVDVVEAHGTGTKLGDPIEAQALIATYGQDRPANRPLMLGSLKSNIGHTQAAAGVAGVIKMIMAMRHGVMPRTLHIDEPSQHVDWSAGAVSLLTESVEWPVLDRPRRAGVSSFGFSGTNAHVILEQPEPETAAGQAIAGHPDTNGEAEQGLPAPRTDVPVPWVVSGRSAAAVGGQLVALAGAVSSGGAAGLPAVVGRALVTQRSSFDFRAGVVGRSVDELLAGLTDGVGVQGVSGVVSGGVASGGLGVVFPGQGVQVLGMGRGLYGAFPVFAGAFDEVCAVLDPLLGFGLREVLWAEPGSGSGVDVTGVAQPGLFAVEVALFRLWLSWGVRPVVVAGHSVGEIGAAWAAGVLSLVDACRLVVARAGLMQGLPPGGVMVAVSGSEADVAGVLGVGVQVAAVNGPGSVVLSGVEGDVVAAVGVLEGRGLRCRWLRVSHGFHSVLMDPMLDDFADAIKDIEFHPPVIAVVSTVTGERVDQQMGSAGYWVGQVRGSVRFADAVTCMAGLGVRSFLEVGPGGVLSGLIPSILDTLPDGGASVVVPSLRGADEALSVTSALASLHVHGVPVDWDAYYRTVHGVTGDSNVDLPTYAFQRRHFWLEPAVAVGDVTAAGLVTADHPLLGAAIPLPDSGGYLFTGRLSLLTHPWLADHVVAGTVVLPGTAFVELALRAGDQVGCPTIDELTIEVPFVIAEAGPALLQMIVGGLDPSGRRPFAVYSRDVADDDAAPGDAEWTRHAGGFLSTVACPPITAAPTWPPSDAVTVPIEDLYPRLASAGLRYGPTFRGLQAVWRDASGIYADVELPADAGVGVERFGIHPALLDAALHASGLGVLDDTPDAARLPFALSGVSLAAAGSTRLRVRLQAAGTDTISVMATDVSGNPVVGIQALTLRPLPNTDSAGTTSRLIAGALLQTVWEPSKLDAGQGSWAMLGKYLPDYSPFDNAVLNNAVLNNAVLDNALPESSEPNAVQNQAVLHSGRPNGRSHRTFEGHELDNNCGVGTPGVILAAVFDTAGDLGQRAHRLAADALDLVQRWLADEQTPRIPLTVITRNAIAAGDDPAGLDPAGSVVWGLLRTAQTENPGRFALADIDGELTPPIAELIAATVTAGATQLAVRNGTALLPALSPERPADGPQLELDPAGTVLITGAGGALGSLLAEHLVTRYGARHLLLVGRRADGPQATLAALAELGAHARYAACDVADRSALSHILADIPTEHPLTAVIHAAGVLDDGVVTTQTAEKLHRVLRPKVDGAINLDELTRGQDLRMFVLFSSVAGVVGASGQANYAAANAFLDGLAARRVADGEPGSALSWGVWETSSTMTAALNATSKARMSRSGLVPLSDVQGLALFDAALRSESPAPTLARFDRAILRNQAAAGELPAILRNLAPRAHRRTVAGPSGKLVDRVAGLTESDRIQVLTEIVTAQVGAVLGYSITGELAPDRALRDLGFDSLTSVELRNRLNAVTGLRLPATLVFDHPSPVALARHLSTELTGTAASVVPVRRPTPPGDADEPIAIIGMSCRFPGGVSSPEGLWELVSTGADAVTEFPVGRGWNVDELFDPDPDAVGKTTSRHGAFLHQAADFDADFFGISPREALAMDPQQRLLLETAWEAFESAGIEPGTLRGSDTGVYAGMMYHDYGARLTGAAGEFEGYLSSGSAGAVASGRVSYSFGLEGPAVTVDTACSSSLVAMHLAGQSLRRGECSLALAGGVTVMATPSTFVEFSRQRGLSVDGRCKAFAAAADGTGWGEGVGLLVLERLSDARRNGRRVWGVIRGSAVNQDGASNGLTAPNGPSQQRVIRAALASAGLSAVDVDVVEAHGTGTRLGDPIEAQALIATYGQGRAVDRPLFLGSLKSNIGHTQAAAGVGGVIKMIMAMRHGVMPKTLHVDEPSPHVDWSAGAVSLLTESAVWPVVDRPRRAAVSSFGISGTNAHVILEQPEFEAAAEQALLDLVGTSASVGQALSPACVDSAPVPWVVSGRSEAAVAGQVGALAAAFPAAAPAVVGHALLTQRAGFECRLAAVGRSTAELVAGISGGSVSGRVLAGRLGVVFPGQGVQVLGMGRGLYEAFPVFAGAFDEVCAVLDPLLGFGLREVLWAEPGSGSGVDVTGVAQPGLFAVEVALFRLWLSWGVRPVVVAGHSVGEIGAAWAAGVLSLVDACRLVVARAGLMQGLPPGGVMVAVSGSEADVAGVLGVGVQVAAVNGPGSVVLSGVEGDVVAAVGVLEGRGLRCRWLRVSHGFHSVLMDPMLDDFADAIKDIEFHPPVIAVVSTVTGERVDQQMGSAGYWVGQVRGSVRFADAVTCMAGLGVRSFLEVGPGGVLSGLIPSILDTLPDGGASVVVPSLRGADEALSVTSALASLHVHGVPVDWDAYYRTVHGVTGNSNVDLPTYAFQHKSLWLQAAPSTANLPGAGVASAAHPLLGASVSLPESDGYLFTGRVSARTHPWLADHVVGGTVLLPGTAIAEMAVRAGDEVGCGRIDELTISSPIALIDGDEVDLRVSVGESAADGRRQVACYSRARHSETNEWTRHAEGFLTVPVVNQFEQSDSAALSPASWPPPAESFIDIDDLYQRLADSGLQYGPQFAGLRAAWRIGDGILAEVELPEDNPHQTRNDSRFAVHPALFDSALHALALMSDEPDSARVPFVWSGLQTYGAPPATMLRVRITRVGDERFAILASDPDGRPVLSVDSLAVRGITAVAAAIPMYRLQWREHQSSTATPDRATPSSGLVLLGAHTLPGDSTTPRYDSLETLLAATDSPPALVLTQVCAGPGGGAQDVQKAVVAATELAQSWLEADGLAETRLVVLTTDALAARPGDSAAGLAESAVWGLIRAAESENPGRFALLDHDSTAESLSAIAQAARTGEEQLALRSGIALVPRLIREDASVQQVSISGPVSMGSGTVLVTGATGALGRAVCRHLITDHGVRSLLLISRRGSADLRAELTSMGAEVIDGVCDAADRDALTEVLTSVPTDRPLTAVIHAAGVLDDAVIGSLTSDRIQHVLRPKVDAALNLDSLTEGIQLAAFVLFSSVAGIFGGPGQGNYAAANTFLDSLAQRRRARGRTGTSLAWGPWDGVDGMAVDRDTIVRRRAERDGIRGLAVVRALEMLDRGLQDVTGDGLLVPVNLDLPAVRRRAGSAVLPAPLRGLVGEANGRGRTRRGDGIPSVRDELIYLPADERESRLLGVLSAITAEVLGHGSAADVGPKQTFQQLGFDSLLAVQLRNRLSAQVGIRLPATLIFDYPTPAVLARFVISELFPTGPANADGRTDDRTDQEIRRFISNIPLQRMRDTGLLDALLKLRLDDTDQKNTVTESSSAIDDLDAEALVHLALRGAGS